MEKINVAELLKDCPKGMELDCVLYDDVTLSEVIDHRDNQFPIKIAIGANRYRYLTKTGNYDIIPESKCVIFPKGKTTWDGFQRPFEDGDIVATMDGSWIGITEGGEKGIFIPTYCVIKRGGVFEVYFDRKEKWAFDRLATKEEKQKLFQAIKDNGYKWNPYTKTLEKLIEPNFKVGDWVTDGVSKCQIYFIDNTQYWYSENCILGSIESVDKQYHLWTIDDAKDGDVLFHSDSASNGIFIFKEILQCGTIEKVVCHCDYDSEDGFCLGENHTCCWADSKILRPATEEQRNRLFQKMREAGYTWNSKTKTLEKLIQPQFKVGDKVRHKNNHNVVFTIISIEEDSYVCGTELALWFDDQDNYELVPNKFDIHTLTPLEPVLVRNTNGQVWTIDFFSHIIDTNKGLKPSIVCVGHCPNQCIPYKGNEFLRGTTDDCKDFYKTWE